MTTHPAYDELRQVTPYAGVILENNPGAMTLEGTNTWLLKAPGAPGCVIVDPGYEDEPHLTQVAETAGEIELILVTHHHPDHVEGAPWLASRAAAPIRAFDPTLCADADPLMDGEVLEAAGLTIEVIHTPGHTEDSICLKVENAILTGDSMLGRGTTVISELGPYLTSLGRLTELPAGTLALPGHGPELPDAAKTAQEYLTHREARLNQVRAALRELGPEATAREVVEHVYQDVDQSLWGPAEWSVQAQLTYLKTTGEAK
jgi:glyoxylase-like metal-dependent hydrolase (beta-lactamase superfamily II)